MSDTLITEQIPPVGPMPDVSVLLVGALAWKADPDVLALVADDDLADPQLATVLGAIRGMASAGRTVTPQLVLDELARRGAHRAAMQALIEASTSGAAVGAAREYAAAAVSASLRRQIESGGTALTSAADEAAETDLPILAATIAKRCASTADRLARLRGDTE
jgi:replicative DNA helicase